MGTIQNSISRIKSSVTSIKASKSRLITSLINLGVDVNENTKLDELSEILDNFDIGGSTGGNSSGSSTFTGSALKFYDYDGTLLHSYSREGALALTELPSLPDRSKDGLVCQGWNWELGQIKSYLTEYTFDYTVVEVGAMYITNDGATWIDINIPDDGRLNHPLSFMGDASIDWGDGVTETKNITSAGVVTHNYPTPGRYRIKLTVNSGTLSLGGNIATCNISGANSNSSSNPSRVYSNRIENVFIGDSVTSIGDYAFQYCYSLTSITIPNSVTSIGDYALQTCYSLTSITIPNSVTSIGKTAFNSCYSLQSITIPNSVTSIGTNVFQYCYSLTSITIPNSVTSIGINTFYNCHSLRSITIPNSVTSMDGYVFYYCYSLTSITIPNLVTSIGLSTFNACYGIAKYDFSTHTSVPSLANTNAFTGLAKDAKILVPEDLYDEWIAATNWTKYASYIVAVVDPRKTRITYTDGTSESILIEGELTGYSNRDDIATVEIGTGVTSIGSSAFKGDSNLSSVMIPSSVTTIRDGAFYGCSGLTSVTIPSSVTTIGGMVFFGCNSLTKIDLSEHDTPPRLGTTTTIPSNVTTIYIKPGTLSAWQSAMNWSTMSDKFQEKTINTDENMPMILSMLDATTGETTKLSPDCSFVIIGTNLNLDQSDEESGFYIVTSGGQNLKCTVISAETDTETGENIFMLINPVSFTDSESYIMYKQLTDNNEYYIIRYPQNDETFVIE